MIRRWMSWFMSFQAKGGEAMAKCSSCDDTGYVCENHPNRPWKPMSIHPKACDCGAGMPCPDCTTPVPQDGTHSITDNFVPRAAKH